MSKTKQDVLKIAEKYNLKLIEDTLIFNESGLDFQVVFAHDTVGKEWVLRIPRRKDVVLKTETEKRILDLVNQYNSFQAPNWIIYTDELIAYNKLDGIPMGTIDHEIKNYIWEIDVNHVPKNLHKTLGSVLANLHRIPKDKAYDFGLVVHSPEEARQSMKNRMDVVKDKFGVRSSLWHRWQTWLDNDDLWPKVTGLIHGDIHAGHILIDQNANVTGLIDWTEAKYTDVANDFIFHYKAFGEEGVDLLIEAYKEAGGLYWPRMKEHIIELDATYPVAIAEFAMSSGLKEYEEMAKQILNE